MEPASTRSYDSLACPDKIFKTKLMQSRFLFVRSTQVIVISLEWQEFFTNVGFLRSMAGMEV